MQTQIDTPQQQTDQSVAKVPTLTAMVDPASVALRVIGTPSMNGELPQEWMSRRKETLATLTDELSALKTALRMATGRELIRLKKVVQHKSRLVKSIWERAVELPGFDWGPLYTRR